MLGTGGGWMVPSANSTSNCPGDIYTTSGCGTCLGCPEDEATAHAVTEAVDLWLCSDPCTPETPCLWDVEADPEERTEVAAQNPVVVQSMLARLRSLQASFTNGSSSGDLGDNGRFCEVLNLTEVVGLGSENENPDNCVNGKEFKVLDVLSPSEFIIDIDLEKYKDAD